MKLSLQDGEDHTKFPSLVECLAKAGKEAFCGFLRVEVDDQRPLCLMSSSGDSDSSDGEEVKPAAKKP